MPDDDATDATDATETDAHDVTKATGVPADGGPSGTEADDTPEPTEDGVTDGAGEDDAEGSATETGPATSPGDDDPTPKAEGTGEFDVGAAEARLEDVEKEIEQGRQALANVSQEVEPEPDGPPVAAGEGAANAPPG